MGRSSFGKRDRERSKQAKADAKRERRLTTDQPAGDGVGEPTPNAKDAASAMTLLRMIEDVHHQHEAGQISDDVFQATKADLLGRLPVD